MLQKPKKIWRKNFEIKKTHFQMASPILFNIPNYHIKTVGKKILNEVIWIQQDYENTATYFVVNELRELIEKTIEVMQKNPKLINDIHKKAKKYNIDYFNYAKSILKMDLKKLSSAQLAKIYDQLVFHQHFSHGISLPTTWFVDSDGEDLSKLLMKRLENIIKAKKSDISIAETFSALTTPEKESMAIKEEIESLKILKEIKNNTQAKKIFLQNDIQKIENDLEKIDIKIKNKILGHYTKWHWMPYTYTGPAYDLDYYLTAWSGLLKENIDINKHLKDLAGQTKEAKEKKQKILKELRPDKLTKQLLDISAEIIYLKAFRKDCFFHGMYVLNKLLIEISRRLKLSLKQVRFMTFWEVAPAIKKGSFSAKILNERIKFSVYYQKGKKGIIYTGDKAKKFLKSQNFEKIEIKKVDHLEGTSACPGKVKGLVKIINVPEEMGKMEKNNVMVSHTTFPALVPAMKKASAIVTDDGGITCHAAIVARELKTPCVVGTKIATQVLKDGDKVEVDANKGGVKILK